MLYKEAASVQIDLGRFSTAAKLQKEIAELYEAENDLGSVRLPARARPHPPPTRAAHAQAMEAFQTAADYYSGEESTSAANQCLLKVAGFAAATLDYKKAIDIYEQASPQQPLTQLWRPPIATAAHRPQIARCRWRSAAWRTRCSNGA